MKPEVGRTILMPLRTRTRMAQRPKVYKSVQPRVQPGVQL